MALTLRSERRTGAGEALLIVGWVAAIAFLVLPLFANVSALWSVLGAVLGIRLLEETLAMTTDARRVLRVAYVAVAVVGLAAIWLMG